MNEPPGHLDAPSAPASEYPLPGGPSGSSDTGRPRRRRLIALGAGILLAAAVGLILISGRHSSPSSSGAQVAPGVDSASASLLDLDVISPNQAPLAPNFDLLDQQGSPTSLQQFRGKTVIWSLNDDQCTDLCALFAQDVVAADRDLGSAAKDVEFVSVNANPYYPSPAAVKAWSVQNDLESLPNWAYVTGTPAQLAQTWRDYHVTVQTDPKTRTVVHDALLEFIDPSGRSRAVGYFAQGSLSTSYFAHAMAQMANDLLPGSEQVQVGGTAINAASTHGATIGDGAPAFALNTLGGQSQGQGTGQGRAGASPAASALTQLDHVPLVLNFWASTCAICVQEMPALQQVQSSYGTKINVVGVDVADPRSAAASFARKVGARYPLLADADGTVAARYRVDALPVTFVIAPGGTILARHDGALTTPELTAILNMDFQNLAPGG